jgi:hypothetical protein
MNGGLRLQKASKSKGLCLFHNIVLQICLPTIDSCRQVVVWVPRTLLNRFYSRAGPSLFTVRQMRPQYFMEHVTVNGGFHRAMWKQDDTDLKKEAITAAANKDKGSFHMR